MKYETQNKSIEKPTGAVAVLHSNEGDEVFVLNDGGRKEFATGLKVKLEQGEVGIILPSPKASVDAVSRFVNESGEIKVEVKNDASVACFVKPQDVIAEMVIINVCKVEKSRGRSATTSKV
jgi:dUTPase